MRFTNLLKSLILESSRFKALYDANVEPEGQKDYYTMLGLKKTASQQAINSKIEAIKEKLESNPEKDSPKFDELKKAIDTLGNEQKERNMTQVKVKEYLSMCLEQSYSQTLKQEFHKV